MCVFVCLRYVSLATNPLAQYPPKSMYYWFKMYGQETHINIEYRQNWILPPLK